MTNQRLVPIQSTMSPRRVPMLLALLSIAAFQNANVNANTTLSAMQEVFADELTSALYGQENDCTSALGVSMAFSLIYPAAIGDAQTQMQTVLGYPIDNQQLVWANASSKLTEAYSGQCIQTAYQNDSVCEIQAPVVDIANSIWIRDGVTPNASYFAVIGSFAHSLNFSDANAGGTINSWVSNSTNGLIDSIVSDGPLDPSWVLVAINAIHMKAAWDVPFDESYTNEDVFYDSPARTTATDSKAHFMHKVEYFPYSSTAMPGYQILRLGFNGRGTSSGLSIIFVLPGIDTDEMVSSVGVLATLPELESTRIALALPKFKFEATYSDNLMEALQAAGLTAPFAGGLCVQEGSCEDLINFIIQKTLIDVNEKGVEAAAVTAMAVAVSMPTDTPVEVLCDHAFQFFIYDEDTDVVLFEGRVVNPGIPDGSTAPLEAQHSDSDFWKKNFYIDKVIQYVPPNVTTTTTIDHSDNSHNQTTVQNTTTAVQNTTTTVLNTTTTQNTTVVKNTTAPSTGKDDEHDAPKNETTTTAGRDNTTNPTTSLASPLQHRGFAVLASLFSIAVLLLSL